MLMANVCLGIARAKANARAPEDAMIVTMFRKAEDLNVDVRCARVFKSWEVQVNGPHALV